MSEYQKVRTLEDCDSLNSDEIVEGYFAGRDGWPEPGNNQPRSFWHGWRNGAMDAGLLPHDEASRELARVTVASWKKPL